MLRHDGEDLLDRPLVERLNRLDDVVPPPSARSAPNDLPTSPRRSAFQADALERGHEGVMAKAPNAPYAAGRRGSAWIKVKTARTLDLVVLAAEWGSGRRKGWLSNLHLGARDPHDGRLRHARQDVQGHDGRDSRVADEGAPGPRRREREGHIVFVRPELVVEVAFNEVQRSSQYPGGVTLRFARIKGYRPDKRASEADTIDAVRAFAVDEGAGRGAQRGRAREHFPLYHAPLLH